MKKCLERLVENMDLKNYGHDKKQFRSKMRLRDLFNRKYTKNSTLINRLNNDLNNKNADNDSVRSLCGSHRYGRSGSDITTTRKSQTDNDNPNNNNNNNNNNNDEILELSNIENQLKDNNEDCQRETESLTRNKTAFARCGGNNLILNEENISCINDISSINSLLDSMPFDENYTHFKKNRFILNNLINNKFVREIQFYFKILRAIIFNSSKKVIFDEDCRDASFIYFSNFLVGLGIITVSVISFKRLFKLRVSRLTIIKKINWLESDISDWVGLFALIDA
jgi:hypothetical protein